VKTVGVEKSTRYEKEDFATSTTSSPML